MREAINPRTGRRERVFVDLEAIYPDFNNSDSEMSFEELRAISRGWMDRDWRKPLQQISENVQSKLVDPPKLAEGKAPRKMKVLEVKGETQTSKNAFFFFLALMLRI